MKAITIFASLLLISFLLVKCTQKDNPLPKTDNSSALESEKTTQQNRVKRGEYLVSVIGCDDCHSPKIMLPVGFEIDFKRRMSGAPANQQLPEIKDKSILKDYMVFSTDFTTGMGPWGTSFSANLTPDDTGIGNWSEAQFIKAIREGKLKGMDQSRPLLPPMPWFIYKNMTDEDLKSIFAFLQTLPPINNTVAKPIPPVN
ncbi:MAG: hypothetical protein DHS20C18_10960 [Saprospiraceae bacterium]|nr:MAG: hypothetical protein DHS20C18_10960 [Saprospiraceae bacterium]